MPLFYFFMLSLILASCQDKPQESHLSHLRKIRDIEQLIAGQQLSLAAADLDLEVKVLTKLTTDHPSNIDLLLLQKQAMLIQTTLSSPFLQCYLTDPIAFIFTKLNNNHPSPEELLQLQQLENELSGLLADAGLLSASGQGQLHLLLATLYSLWPGKSHLAAEQSKQLQEILWNQMRGLQESKNRYNPNVFAIQQLKRRLRAAQLSLAESYFFDQQGELSLPLLLELYPDAEKALKRFHYLSKQIDQLQHTAKDMPSSIGINAAEMEIRQSLQEQISIEKNLIFQLLYYQQNKDLFSYEKLAVIIEKSHSNLWEKIVLLRTPLGKINEQSL